MIGWDQITVSIRIGTVVRDFGPNCIRSGLWSPDNWSEILVRPIVRTEFVGPIHIGPVHIFFQK